MRINHKVTFVDEVNFKTALAMNDASKRIDDLHQSFYTDIIVEGERKSYTLLSFRPFFAVEQIVGISRQSEDDGELRSPRWYERVYSIMLATFILYFSNPLFRSSSGHRMGTLFDNIFFSLSHALDGSIYLVSLVRNGLVGPGKRSMRPFKALCELDAELNILGHRDYHTKLYRQHTFSVTWVLIINCILVGGMIAIGDIDYLDVIAVFPFAFLETQPMMCSALAVSLNRRLKHLILISKCRHLKAGNSEASGFELRGAEEFSFQRITFVYEKIMEVFSELNDKFALKMLAYFLSTSSSTLVILWIFLMQFHSEESTYWNYLVYAMYFVRAFIRISRYCIDFESFTLAREQFRMHLIQVVRLHHPEWSPQARTLLAYIEASPAEFSILNLFQMDIQLPFAFMSAMLSLYIALVQIILF